jgi:hypothetical protein
MLLAQACCDADGPCLDWIRRDETYSVELVARAKASDSSLFPHLPGHPDRNPQLSCGAFDLDVGDILQATSAGRTEVQACTCGVEKLEMDVPNVATIEEVNPGRVDTSSWVFARQERVVVGETCQGTHSIGIMAVPETADEPITDHVLFREFTSSPPDVCRPVDGMSVRIPCGDTWFVHIRRANGELVTRNLREPDNDGGAR